jgi:hypothetical protein
VSRQAKGNTTTRVLTREESSEDSAESSAAHRRKLEALFGNTKETASTPAPRPRERVFSNPRKSIGRSPSEYRLRLERLRIARGEEIESAVDVFLQHHQLPDDLDILYKVLQHSDEKIIRDALGQLSALLMQDRVPSTLLLLDRLAEIEERATEASTQSYVTGLRDQIAKFK